MRINGLELGSTRQNPRADQYDRKIEESHETGESPVTCTEAHINRLLFESVSEQEHRQYESQEPLGDKPPGPGRQPGRFDVHRRSDFGTKESSTAELHLENHQNGSGDQNDYRLKVQRPYNVAGGCDFPSESKLPASAIRFFCHGYG